MSTYRMDDKGMPVPTDERGMPKPQPQRLTAGQCRYCGHLIVLLNVGWAIAAGAEYPIRCESNAEGHKPATKPPTLTDRDALEAWLDD